MRGFWFLLCFVCIVGSCSACVFATASDCDACPLNGTCMIDATVSAEIAHVDLTAEHPVIATARRSAGFVGRAVAAPAKLIGRTLRAVKNRNRKPVLKAAAAVGRLGGRLICPRRRCRTGACRSATATRPSPTTREATWEDIDDELRQNARDAEMSVWEYVWRAM